MSDEKAHPASEAVKTTHSEVIPADQSPKRRAWWKRFPFAPLGAIFAILLGIFAALYSLHLVNGEATAILPWIYMSPNVALSLCTLLITSMLQLMISEGSAITWWTTARDGAELQELQRQWELKSLFGTLWSMRKGKFGRMALATLAVTAVSASGALFQRSVKPSSWILAESPIETTNVKVRFATALPHGWSGVEDGTGALNFLAYNFTTLVKDAVQNSDIILVDESAEGANTHVCPTTGSCYMILQGIGLSWNAALVKTTQSEAILQISDFASAFHKQDFPQNATVGFYVNFSKPPPQDVGKYLMQLDILTKQAATCDGQVEHIQIRFVPAIVSYLVGVWRTSSPQEILNINGDRQIMQSGSLHATLMPDYYINPQQWETQLGYGGLEDFGNEHQGLQKLHQEGIRYVPPVPIENFNEDPTIYGGLITAFENIFTSYTRFHITPGSPPTTTNDSTSSTTLIDSFGMLTQEYYYNGVGEDMDAPIQSPCEAVWFEPSLEIIDFINNVMLRSAVRAATDNIISSVNEAYITAAKIEYLPTYSVEWHFAILAAVIPALAILFILPTFWGFWRLEKKHTISPVEVAEAFSGREGQPQQRVFGPGSHGFEVGEMLEKIGGTRVRYQRLPDGDWAMVIEG